MNRLRTFAVAILLTLVPGTSALGQTRLIVGGGLNLASFAFSVDEEDLPGESVTRLALGLTAGIPMSGRSEFHLGAGYSQKGFGILGVALEVDYLEFTTQFGAAFSLNESASVHLLTGPALAFKVSCSVSGSFLGEEISEDCGEADVESIDLGLASGARLEIGVSDGIGIWVGSMYNLGLWNIEDTETGEGAKNRVLTFQAGVVFSIG